MGKQQLADTNHLLTLAKPEKDRGGPSAAATQTDSAIASAEDVQRRKIAEAAYYRSEKRCFSPGFELADWLAAEAEITGCGLQREVSGAELH